MEKNTVVKKRLEERLTPLLERFVKNGPAGVACSVTQNDEVLFERCFGYADLEMKNPISLDTIYRIYSMTKVVTCVAALQLYERGVYLLSDPLHEYLPEFAHSQVYRYNSKGQITTRPAARPIQIRDLFTMTSGLTYGGNDMETAREIGRRMAQLREKEKQGEPYDVRTFVKAIADVPLAFDPGTHWHYGLSHDVLGALIEVWSGKSFGQYLYDEIFSPLQMNDTFFRLPDDKKDRLCSMYRRNEDGTLTKITDMDTNYQPESKFEGGGGGLLSTLRDYARFAQALANGGTLGDVRILSPNTIALMSTNHLGHEQMQDYNWDHQAGYGYGLGVRVMIDRARGGSNGSLGEFGWMGLAGTWMMVDVENRLSAVYMQQLMPNLEAIHQPRLRQVIYGAL